MEPEKNSIEEGLYTKRNIIAILVIVALIIVGFLIYNKNSKHQNDLPTPAELQEMFERLNRGATTTLPTNQEIQDAFNRLEQEGAGAEVPTQEEIQNLFERLN